MKTDDKYREQQIVSYWATKFKEAMVAKAPYTKDWSTYWEAYRGDYFKNKSRPDYKSDLVSNYIFSIVETIRPIMLDNDPKFQSIPRQPDGMPFANDLQEVLSFEWDREKMTTKLYRELITTLVTGTSVYFLPWDAHKKEVRAIPINPFNLFPDPLATGIDDAEYIIYASYYHAGKLKEMFPKKKEHLSGGDVTYSELVYENNRNSNLRNQVLVLEVWSRDYEAVENNASEGTPKTRYPNGRVLTICPELGIVLSDKPNPYADGKFPFVLHKDYDIPGKFWGEGEVAQLISPQKYMNELNNSILDNAKATANMPWLVDKNSGIPHGKITSRPGLVLRRNPGSNVERMQAPNMPGYVVNAVEQYKSDMEQISGIFDTLKGNSETGVYTAQGILALQEAGQARVRLKVKLMEESLGELARLWYSRLQQFWKEERWVRITLFDGTYDFKKMRKELLKNDYDIKILAGSTMPVNRGAMLDLMIRLAQTQMPDGSMLVDREAVAQYLPAEVKNAMMQRMDKGKEQLTQQVEQLGQMIQQIQGEFEQFAQQDQKDDQNTMQLIDELSSAIEGINKQVVQSQQESAKMKEEQARAEQEAKLKDEAYNSGFTDAETMMAPQAPEEDPLADLGEEDDLGLPLPEDIMNGIETLSDDELKLLLESNPQLAQLLS